MDSKKGETMIEAIENRRSVRNYQKKALSVDDATRVQEILEFMQAQKGPFGHHVNFFFVDNKNPDGKKIGTYGFIKHPPTFIGGVVKNTLDGMVDFGYLFEQVILLLTMNHLGTVWLGGTFTRDDFSIDHEEDEIIACVSPVGYPANKSMREKVIRGFSKADKRLPFDELFFYGKDLKALPRNHKYRPYLEAVQVGPSASNKQPWRIVLVDQTFHLFLKRTKGYGTSLKMDIQAIDMGIALSHLYLSLREDGLKVSFEEKKPFALEGAEYIMSLKIMD